MRDQSRFLSFADPLVTVQGSQVSQTCRGKWGTDGWKFMVYFVSSCVFPDDDELG